MAGDTLIKRQSLRFFTVPHAVLTLLNEKWELPLRGETELAECCADLSCLFSRLRHPDAALFGSIHFFFFNSPAEKDQISGANT